MMIFRARVLSISDLMFLSISVFLLNSPLLSHIFSLFLYGACVFSVGLDCKLKACFFSLIFCAGVTLPVHFVIGYEVLYMASDSRWINPTS